MAVALIVLALAMIAGGVYGMVEGWQIVVLEQGWAMMIAGSAVTAGGAALLGTAFAVLRLGQIRRELARMGERLGRTEPAFPEPPPRIDPVAAVSSGLLANGAPGSPPQPPADPLPPVTNPVQAPLGTPALGDELLPSAARTGPAEPPVSWPAAAPEPRLPDFLAGNPAPEPPVPSRSDAAPQALRAASAPEENAPFAPADPVVPDTAAAEPLNLPGRPAEPGAPAGGTGPAASGDGTAVIGTYTSGGNRYVMFADGSIDAETPDGVFRFQSLDELKTFIASGGEGPRQG